MKCDCILKHSVNESQSCDRATGECLCNQFWNGTRCGEDVDECHENSEICGINTVCNNTMGSHECNCDVGYTIDDEGHCTLGRYYFYLSYPNLVY